MGPTAERRGEKQMGWEEAEGLTRWRGTVPSRGVPRSLQHRWLDTQLPPFPKLPGSGGSAPLRAGLYGTLGLRPPRKANWNRRTRPACPTGRDHYPSYPHSLSCPALRPRPAGRAPTPGPGPNLCCVDRAPYSRPRPPLPSQPRRRPREAFPPHSRPSPVRSGASPLGVLGLQQPQVGLPFVADDLATGEAANGDDHGYSYSAGALWTRWLSGFRPRPSPGAPKARGWPGPPAAAPSPPRQPSALSAFAFRGDELRPRVAGVPGASRLREEPAAPPVRSFGTSLSTASERGRKGSEGRFAFLVVS